METHVIVGAVLIMVGLSEIPIAFVVGSKVPEHKRPALMAALGMSGLATIGLGVAFLAGVIPLGG